MSFETFTCKIPINKHTCLCLRIIVRPAHIYWSYILTHSGNPSVQCIYSPSYDTRMHTDSQRLMRIEICTPTALRIQTTLPPAYSDVNAPYTICCMDIRIQSAPKTLAICLIYRMFLLPLVTAASGRSAATGTPVSAHALRREGAW